ncbi:hypothetical protein THASP1DRAFT_23892 [Thamnocephalis sphaerospora]|uniref:GDP/GTP exchange factor Sec2 N-terminal domain-containing protein n=1 Tax=Thamnocephalis sphaerospora TaxID=78915 RepID=A0A4P9XPV6_9FUNG|nr:hypothetical protein THASP1DRAFT_23892 [Thamnocephalis sphaerospora]|eukprot:RKP08054.1 hypothetical protein THASP1DRAFT_23892 [Thamnocephalis sphaerospora]
MEAVTALAMPRWSGGAKILPASSSTSAVSRSPRPLPAPMPIGRSVSAHGYTSMPSTPIRATTGADGPISVPNSPFMRKASLGGDLAPMPLPAHIEDDEALAFHAAQLSARCEELERSQLALQRENERWRREVDEMRAAKLNLEQELSAVETRLALVRPATPLGLDLEQRAHAYASDVREIDDGDDNDWSEARASAEPQCDASSHDRRPSDEGSGNTSATASPTLETTSSRQLEHQRSSERVSIEQPVAVRPSTPNTFLSPAITQESVSLTEQLRYELQRTSEKLIAEKRLRGELEQAKANIEAQLEDLSRTVFEEAQKMVVEERRARAEAERKRDSYAARVRELQDVEQMLKAQLDELKRLVESVMSTDAAQRHELAHLRQQQLRQLPEEEDDIDRNEDSDDHADPAADLALTSEEERNRRTRLIAGVHHPARGSVGSVNSLPGVDSAYGSDLVSPTAVSAAKVDPIAPLLAFDTRGVRYAEFESFYQQCQREANIFNAAYSRQLRGSELAAAVALVTEPVSTSTSRFLRRVQADDVEPCVRFSHAGYFLQRKITAGVQAGTLILEAIAASDARQLSVYRTATIKPGATYHPQCALCEQECPFDATHRLYLEGERERERERRRHDETTPQQRLVCPDCRIRLVAACEFWAYVRLLRRGLVRVPQEQVYLDTLRHRLRMFLARAATRGAATLPVHGAHTGSQPIGGARSLPGSSIASASAPGLSPCSSVASNSLPPSPRVLPTKQLVGGGRDPELADTTGGQQRTQWRSSMADAMAGARRSWATLSQMTI